MFEVRQITYLPGDKVILAGEGASPLRLRRWGGKSRPTDRFKWTPQELHLSGLPEGAEYVADGIATPDEVWACVNGPSVWRVTENGRTSWFDNETDAVHFALTGEVAPPTPPPTPPPPAKSRRKPGKAVVDLAKARGVDLDAVVGTGAGGAVKVADVYAHLGEKPPRKGAKVV